MSNTHSATHSHAQHSSRRPAASRPAPTPERREDRSTRWAFYVFMGLILLAFLYFMTLLFI